MSCIVLLLNKICYYFYDLIPYFYASYYLIKVSCSPATVSIFFLRDAIPISLLFPSFGCTKTTYLVQEDRVTHFMHDEFFVEGSIVQQLLEFFPLASSLNITLYSYTAPVGSFNFQVASMKELLGNSRNLTILSGPEGNKRERSTEINF